MLDIKYGPEHCRAGVDEHCRPISNFMKELRPGSALAFGYVIAGNCQKPQPSDVPVHNVCCCYRTNDATQSDVVDRLFSREFINVRPIKALELGNIEI